MHTRQELLQAIVENRRQIYETRKRVFDRLNGLPYGCVSPDDLDRAFIELLLSKHNVLLAELEATQWMTGEKT